MLRYLGGLTLLAFVFAFVAAPLVGIQPADADPNILRTVYTTTTYYSVNGYFCYSETTDSTFYATENHPPDLEVVAGEAIEEGTGFPYLIYEWVHQDHGLQWDVDRVSESVYHGSSCDDLGF